MHAVSSYSLICNPAIRLCDNVRRFYSRWLNREHNIVIVAGNSAQIRKSSFEAYTSHSCRLKMIAKQGRFVEYSVFGRETSVNWTVISDAKGWQNCVCVHMHAAFFLRS